jgi:hypothetical protein
MLEFVDEKNTKFPYERHRLIMDKYDNILSVSEHNLPVIIKNPNPDKSFDEVEYQGHLLCNNEETDIAGKKLEALYELYEIVNDYLNTMDNKNTKHIDNFLLYIQKYIYKIDISNNMLEISTMFKHNRINQRTNFEIKEMILDMDKIINIDRSMPVNNSMFNIQNLSDHDKMKINLNLVLPAYIKEVFLDLPSDLIWYKINDKTKDIDISEHLKGIKFYHVIHIAHVEHGLSKELILYKHALYHNNFYLANNGFVYVRKKIFGKFTLVPNCNKGKFEKWKKMSKTGSDRLERIRLAKEHNI